MCRFGVPLAPVAEGLDGPWATSPARSQAAQQRSPWRPDVRPYSDDGRSTTPQIATALRRRRHLLQDPPLRRLRVHRITHCRHRSFEPATITVDGRRGGLTTCYDVRFLELYVELARRGAQADHRARLVGSGPGRGCRRSGPCWPGLRALDTTGFIAAVDQAYPGATRSPRSGPTGVGGSLVSLPHRRGSRPAAGADPQLLACAADVDAANQVRDTAAVAAELLMQVCLGPGKASIAGCAPIPGLAQPTSPRRRLPRRCLAAPAPDQSGFPAAGCSPSRRRPGLRSARRPGSRKDSSALAKVKKLFSDPLSAVLVFVIDRSRWSPGAGCWAASCTPAAVPTRSSPGSWNAPREDGAKGPFDPLPPFLRRQAEPGRPARINSDDRDAPATRSATPRARMVKKLDITGIDACGSRNG